MENQFEHDTLRLAEEQLHSRVAWLYHHEGMTQAEIGDRLNITRARVNKILQLCRENGLVQVRVNARFKDCVELEQQLLRGFGLVDAVVMPTPLRENQLHNTLGLAAGGFLSGNLRDGQSLGLGWGKTLRESINYIEQRSASDITIVSLFGGMPRSATTNPYDIASLIARRLDAEACYYIAAPMFVSSKEVRDTLMSQELLKQTFQHAADVDMALIGAGDLTAKATNVVLQALSHEEWKSLLDAGAVGEIFNHFLDAQGRLVDHPLNQQVMSPNLDELLRIPNIVVAAGGVQKAPILKAVLQCGYVHTLITDHITANRILTL